MSEAVHMPAPAQDAGPRAASTWWQRIDQWSERAGDHLNPILVKETRQALKSRQFVVTFSVLLFAALAWTVAGSLSQMPQIYTTPSASRLLIGYYIVLAIPMLLVVPLAAYRSLEGEIDDGTLELLSITALSPWQIVLGKLASASLQMMLYFVALFPCMAYAYTLRGVDLPTTLLIVAILVVSALVLTVVALFLAPLARSRTGRIITLLLLVGILVIAEYGIGAMVIGMIVYGIPFAMPLVFFLVMTTLLVSLSLSHLLLAATAAQLTPESENRSTHLRISMMVVTMTLIGIATYATESMPRNDASTVLSLVGAALLVFWVVCGSLMVAESSVTTPRIRRELPQSFFARVMLTWVTPGPATGLVFATVNILVVTAFTLFTIRNTLSPTWSFAGGQLQALTRLSVLLAAYLIGFLIAVRWLIAVVRIRNNPRVEIGVAGLIAVLVLSSLIPYSIGMHLNDYRPFAYSRWQITNWVWTLGEAAPSGAVDWTEIGIVVAAVVIALIGCLLTMPRIVLPRRTATPEKVQQELETA
ncbi:ABC transporter permease [Novipirellula artificiosorum]|uniref:ABC-2 family transporter protein n=1 Tax=Novipirellula artificiosorum TaxID=2528016 RepID=A0A5C6DQX9_9BACT|nr:ABC transporter permease [Novipirellula artificiosorum]TWU39168.1 ABC-2 family transporter protein [Novipirellula artificiosorum]